MIVFVHMIDDEIPCYTFPKDYQHNAITGEDVAIGYQDGEYAIPYELMARYNTIMKDFEDLQEELWEVYNQ